MKNNEFDQIKINNSGKCSDYSEHIRAYDNDSPRFIKENSLSKQTETYRVKELSDEVEQAQKGQSLKIDNSEDQDNSILQEGAQSASSAMSSIASTIGSGIGALAGAVATAVVAAVVVVVAFVSTLTINLSLFMADTDSLVFEVEMRGAQEEDFQDPIYAVLTSDDGTYIEKQITLDDVYLTYNDLQPGKEYFIKIKNSEKVFIEKSFFTNKEKIDRGQLITSSKGTLVSVAVRDVVLQQGEYYTLEVKDDKGNVVFTVDSVDPNAEFSFEVLEETGLVCSLSVSGKSYAISQLEVKSGPQYDFENPIWTWAEDKSFAQVTFNDLNGGESLVLDAQMTIKTTDPTCTEDGLIEYFAEAIFEEHNFNDSKEKTIAALGHDYKFAMFVWSNDYKAQAMYKCTHDDSHIELYDAEVISEITKVPNCLKTGEKTYTATYGDNSDVRTETLPIADHDYGELQETEATCTEDGMAQHYHCSVCGKYFDKDKNETTYDALVVNHGHNIEHRDGGFDGTTEMQLDPHYYCTKCGQYYDEDMNEVEPYEIGYPSLSYSNSTQKITIYADGYIRSGGQFVPFVSSAERRYYITGAHNSADQSLDIRTKNHDGSASTGKMTLYMTFDNLTINARNWASALYVVATNELDININNVGTTTIKGYNHPAFAAADSTAAIKISVTSEGDFTNFVCGRKDGSSPTLYNGNVTFYMNGKQADSNGNL